MAGRHLALLLALLAAVAACSGGTGMHAGSRSGGAGAAGGAGAPGSGGLGGAIPDSGSGASGGQDGGACGDKPDLSTGPVADPARIYPTPCYASLGALGARVASVCFDTSALAEHDRLDALAPGIFKATGLTPVAASCACDWSIRFDAAPPALSGAAQTAWTAAAQDPERYALESESAGGRATTAIFAPDQRAALHALYTAVALAQPDGDGKPPRVATGIVVDYPALATRAVLEGFYGAPYTQSDRAHIIRLEARLKQNVYVYGPKNDVYARRQWADPYPAAQAQAISDAAAVARSHLVDFVWSVSPGLPFGALPPGNSIKYSSDADFARLTAKIESVRALGVSRFALFLDDLTGFLVWPEDIAAFPGGLVDAHASLMNRLDDYLRSKDPDSRLIVVGSEYTSFWPTWDAYNTELGKLLHPGIEVLWTGPQIYSTQIQASDLDAIDQKLSRRVSLWDNGPQTISPLTGRSADLAGAIDGLYSNPVVNENGKYPTSAFFKVQGTLADYAWNPAGYDPDLSFERWLPLLAGYSPP